MNDRHRRIAKLKKQEERIRTKKLDSDITIVREALDKARKEFLAIVEAWNRSLNKATQGAKNGAKADKD